MQTLKFPKRDGELAPEAKGSYVSLMDWVPICAPRHGLRLVAVLAAYFDASNTEHALGVTSIVGYVAPLEEWARVEAEWAQAEEAWRLVNAGGFHLAELESPRLL
jgi:hypothetical protein